MHKDLSAIPYTTLFTLFYHGLISVGLLTSQAMQVPTKQTYRLAKVSNHTNREHTTLTQQLSVPLHPNNDHVAARYLDIPGDFSHLRTLMWTSVTRLSALTNHPLWRYVIC
jgi:hypothetical protein